MRSLVDDGMFMKAYGRLVAAVILLALLAGTWLMIESRAQRFGRPMGQGATDTPKPTVLYLEDVAYPPPNDGWLAPSTAVARPTYRAMTAAELAERYRFSTMVECQCHVALEVVREYDSNDDTFLASFLSPERVADLQVSGSVLLIIVHRLDDGSDKPYQAVLTHRDKGGLIFAQAPTLAQLVSRFPTPVP